MDQKFKSSLRQEVDDRQVVGEVFDESLYLRAIAYGESGDLAHPAVVEMGDGHLDDTVKTADDFLERVQQMYPDVRETNWNLIHLWLKEQRELLDFRERTLMLDLMFVAFSAAGEQFAQRLILDQRNLNPALKPTMIAGKEYFVPAEGSTQWFRLVRDVKDQKKTRWGGERWAQKVAGHELKTAQALLDADVEGLEVQLVAVYALLGMKVVAYSAIPIEGRRTLIQGQLNPRESMMRAKRKHEIHGILAKVTRRLRVGVGPLGFTGPFDMEVHRGTDDRFYVRYAPRFFPPVPVDVTKTDRRRLLSQLFRPELVRMSRLPVASDALHKPVMNMIKPSAEALRALRAPLLNLEEMLQERIVQLGLSIAQGDTQVIEGTDVKALLHEHGINMRFLSRVIVATGGPHAALSDELLVRQTVVRVEERLAKVHPSTDTAAMVERIIAKRLKDSSGHLRYRVRSRCGLRIICKRLRCSESSWVEYSPSMIAAHSVASEGLPEASPVAPAEKGGAVGEVDLQEVAIDRVTQLLAALFAPKTQQ